MYNFNGFGERLSVLRKQRGLTQDDLATRLGVTPQAVSKWENDQSYPDISVLPSIAMILGADIDYLFGASDEPDFRPQPELDGLKLVAKFGFTACYSNKPVESINGSFVQFTDGSHAELTNGNVSNTGQGSIRLHTEAGDESRRHERPRREERGRREERESEGLKTFAFDYSDSIDIQVLMNNCEIIPSNDNSTKVTIKGEQKFVDAARVDCVNGKLIVKFEGYNQGFSFFSWNSRKNKGHVLIEVPYTSGKSAIVNVNGSGYLGSKIEKYEQGSLNVHGSGDIHMLVFEALKASVHGSGDIEVNHANAGTFNIVGSGDIAVGSCDHANVSINGSGDIEIGSVTEITASITGSGDLDVGRIAGKDSKFTIVGSGDINVGGGEIDNLIIDIMGSGSFDSGNLTANTANLKVHASGSISLGRVIGNSTEQVSKAGSIKIRQRG